MSYKPKETIDPDAISLNTMLDDVASGIKLGHWLIDLLNRRFEGNVKNFRKWISVHVDRDEQTLCRKMVLAKNSKFLTAHRITRMSDAYDKLQLSGSVTFSRLKD